MSTVFVRFPFTSKYKSIDCGRDGIQPTNLKSVISNILEYDDFALYCNGKEINASQNVLPDSNIHVLFTLPGGKGGFGSMLRAIGAQIEKTTNREACRDLSGRRLRDINEEQRLKKWIAKKSEREAEKVRRRKERLERLKAKPKHNFVDFEYEKEISNLPERIEDALTAGMEKIKKRPAEIDEPSTSTKKKRLWLHDDISESSESDSDQSKSSSKSDENNSNVEIEAGNSISSGSMDDASPLLNSNDGVISETSNSNEAQSSASSSQDKPSNSNEENIIEVVETTKELVIAEVTEPAKGQSADDIIQDDTQTPNNKDSDAPIDLNDYESANELESLGLDRLKQALMVRGLKCGGNLVERAKRLWNVRGLNPDEYPKNLIAKQKK